MKWSEVGEKIFRDLIAPTLPPESAGKLVAIDIDSREYEITSVETLVAWVERLQKKNGRAKLYVLRVGYPAVHTFGGAITPK
jgi:hypothetical protein